MQHCLNFWKIIWMSLLLYKFSYSHASTQWLVSDLTHRGEALLTGAWQLVSVSGLWKKLLLNIDMHQQSSSLGSTANPESMISSLFFGVSNQVVVVAVPASNFLHFPILGDMFNLIRQVGTAERHQGRRC